MSKQLTSKKRFDKFGAEIFCRYCKSVNRDFTHHPNNCLYCYFCGEKGHKNNNCPKNNTTPINTVNIFRIPKLINQGTSARRMPLIDNGFKLGKGEPVAIDVEKVEGFGTILPGWVCVYKYAIKSRKGNAENIVYSAKIRQLKTNVKDYKSRYSGLTRIDLSEEAIPFANVKKRLTEILKDRLVVGIGLADDLKRLEMDDIVKRENTFEFHDHFYDEAHQPISLKILTYAFFSKKIQEFDPDFDPLKGHNPVIDSRMTLKIYNAYKKYGCEPVDGHYGWCRNLVDEAMESGKLSNRLK